MKTLVGRPSRNARALRAHAVVPQGSPNLPDDRARRGLPALRRRGQAISGFLGGPGRGQPRARTSGTGRRDRRASGRALRTPRRAGQRSPRGAGAGDRRRSRRGAEGPDASSPPAAAKRTRTRSSSRARSRGRHKVLAAYRSFHGSAPGAGTLTGENRRWPNEPRHARHRALLRAVSISQPVPHARSGEGVERAARASAKTRRRMKAATASRRC